MSTESKRSSVFEANSGSMLDVLIGEHCEEKYELKRPACLKSAIRVPLNKGGGIVEFFLLLRKLFIIYQYDLADVMGSSNFTLSLFRNLSLA